MCINVLVAIEKQHTTKYNMLSGIQCNQLVKDCVAKSAIFILPQPVSLIKLRGCGRMQIADFVTQSILRGCGRMNENCRFCDTVYTEGLWKNE